MLVTVIPLQANEILKERGRQPHLFRGQPFRPLISFAIPDLIRRFRRRWVYTGGVVMLDRRGALATDTLPGQLGGMLSALAGRGSMLSITLQLYVMDYIRAAIRPVRAAAAGHERLCLGRSDRSLGVDLYSARPWQRRVA